MMKGGYFKQCEVLESLDPLHPPRMFENLPVNDSVFVFKTKAVLSDGNREVALKRRTIILILLLFLPLTVPWWFINGKAGSFLGLPVWALYGLLATIIYAILVAWMMATQWKTLGGEGDTGAE